MIKLFPFILLFTFLVACNKEGTDDNPDPINSIPSAFEVTVSDITLNSAKVTWTASTTVEPTIIQYAIYLNDSLLEENLTETTYELTALDSAVNYTVKVEARNENGSSTALKDFTTLSPTNLRLKSYTEDNYEFILNYNSIGLLSYRDNPSTNGYPNIDFTYNPNHEILTEYSRYRDATGGPSARLTYEYSGTTLTGLTIHQTGEDFTIDYDFQFDALLNYTYTNISKVFTGGPPEIVTNNYSVVLEKNSDGNITKYTRTNTDTSQNDVVEFEYTDKNLTKITKGGDVLEISYDTSNNWHTYRSGFMPDVYNYTANDVGGFIYYPNLIRWLNQIPQFYNFKNVNNPTEYKVNGNVVTSFQYEYNTSNYPNKITIPQRNVIIDLEYEVAE